MHAQILFSWCSPSSHFFSPALFCFSTLSDSPKWDIHFTVKPIWGGRVNQIFSQPGDFSGLIASAGFSGPLELAGTLGALPSNAAKRGQAFHLPSIFRKSFLKVIVPTSLFSASLALYPSEASFPSSGPDQQNPSLQYCRSMFQRDSHDFPTPGFPKCLQ